MGKLGKKARKFAKKNLQSVLKRQRKVKTFFKKKASKRDEKAQVEDSDGEREEKYSGRNNEVEDFKDISLDAVFDEDDSDMDRDDSDSDGYLSEARILALNDSYFLKAGGHFVISIKANCIDSTVPAEAVFESEVKKMVQEQLKPSEQVTLEPFERDHACVVGGYRMPKKQKIAS